jgi:hypothetical protein
VHGDAAVASPFARADVSCLAINGRSLVDAQPVELTYVWSRRTLATIGDFLVFAFPAPVSSHPRVNGTSQGSVLIAFSTFPPSSGRQPHADLTSPQYRLQAIKPPHSTSFPCITALPITMACQYAVSRTEYVPSRVAFPTSSRFL